MQQGADQSQEVTRLLHAVAEQLKTPLTGIARQAELGQLTGEPTLSDLSAIRLQATAALTLVESYLLGLQLLQKQTTLDLEPVSVSSLLVEVAHEFSGLAKRYGVAVELHVAGKYGPVMAHPAGLKSALLALGYALLEGSPAGRPRLTLAAHRTPHGIITGLYGDYPELNTEAWRRALELKGRATQPLAAVSGNGAGLFVADAILQAMSTRLRVGRHLNMSGLAATFQPSQQLSFV